MPNSVYTDTGGRITIDIDDAEFVVLYSIISVAWYLCCQYNNSNIMDACELFSRSGSGYEWLLSGASPKDRFWPGRAKAGFNLVAVNRSSKKGW